MINIYICLFADFLHLFIITFDNLLTIKMMNMDKYRGKLRYQSKELKSFDKSKMNADRITDMLCMNATFFSKF